MQSQESVSSNSSAHFAVGGGPKKRRKTDMFAERPVTRARARNVLAYDFANQQRVVARDPRSGRQEVHAIAGTGVTYLDDDGHPIHDSPYYPPYVLHNSGGTLPPRPTTPTSLISYLDGVRTINSKPD